MIINFILLTEHILNCVKFVSALMKKCLPIWTCMLNCLQVTFEPVQKFPLLHLYQAGKHHILDLLQLQRRLLEDKKLKPLKPAFKKHMDCTKLTE